MSGEPFDSPYVGLDFETSGLDPIHSNHVPLTLGFSWERGGTVECSYFNFSIPGNFDPAAHRVNNLPYPRAYRNQSSIDLYARINDRVLCDYLKHMTEMAGFEEKFIPVGFNVGSFDMVFMNKYFPAASTYFSHRQLELNTLCYALDATGFYVNTKENAKLHVEEVAELTHRKIDWHLAEFDAWAALIIKRYIDDCFTKLADQGWTD